MSTLYKILSYNFGLEDSV